MRRMLTAVLAVCMCSMGVSKAYAGPGCCAKKAADAKMASAGCVAEAGFPTMAMTVADKNYDCPMTAKKAAEAAHSKIVYVVAGEKYGTEESAMTALADASEQYVNRYTKIACVVDGKVMYCGEDCDKNGNNLVSASCSKGGSKTTMVRAEGSGCSKGSAAVAKSEGSGCSKNKSEAGYKSGAVKVSADGKSEKACCMKGKDVKFMVAGRTFKNIEDAQKACDEILAATNKVNMKYVVDGKEVGCSSQVCPMAKKAGKVVYVVREEKMKCEISARIALAKAKYDAARGMAEKLARI